MRISDVVIATLVFVGIVTGFAGFYGEMGQSYVSIQPNLSSSSNEASFSGFNATSELALRIEDMQNRTLLIGTKGKNFNIVAAFMDTAVLFIDLISVLLLIPNVLASFILITVGMPGLSGLIPAWFSGMIMVAVMAWFVFKVISLWLKKEV